MPHKPLRPCNAPGCSALVPSGLCAKHRREHQQRLDTRETATRERAFYWSTPWRKTRARFVRAFPFCEMCKSENLIRLGEEVHHRVPIAAGGDRFAFSNLEHLCKHHHSEITRKEMNYGNR
jgi:5-methylcytosine-specific restriction protein A